MGNVSKALYIVLLSYFRYVWAVIRGDYIRDFGVYDLNVGGDEDIVDLFMRHVGGPGVLWLGEQIRRVLHSRANGRKNGIVRQHVKIPHQDAFFLHRVRQNRTNGIFLR
jgi:hypothetical protein